MICNGIFLFVTVCFSDEFYLRLRHAFTVEYSELWWAQQSWLVTIKSVRDELEKEENNISLPERSCTWSSGKLSPFFENVLNRFQANALFNHIGPSLLLNWQVMTRFQIYFKSESKIYIEIYFLCKCKIYTWKWKAEIYVCINVYTVLRFTI